MSEGSETPDLEEATRRFVEALSRRDLDAALLFFAPDCVVEQETGTLEGGPAIRAFLEEWWGLYTWIELETEEVLDFGNGVGFAVIRLTGCPVGSSGEVQMRLASVSTRTNGLLTWLRQYTETYIQKARAAAERLAQERG